MAAKRPEGAARRISSQTLRNKGRRQSRLLALIIAAFFFFQTPARAVEPDEILADAALEARAREISGRLRCVVCQNQSIDDSDALLARDLRILVRDRLLAGDSDAEVVAFVTDRYGDYVLLRPRFSGETLLIWLAPALLFGAGGFAAFMAMRRARAIAGPPADEEPMRLEGQRR